MNLIRDHPLQPKDRPFLPRKRRALVQPRGIEQLCPPDISLDRYPVLGPGRSYETGSDGGFVFVQGAGAGEDRGVGVLGGGCRAGGKGGGGRRQAVRVRSRSRSKSNENKVEEFSF